jgi:hypothetical protein
LPPRRHPYGENSCNRRDEAAEGSTDHAIQQSPPPWRPRHTQKLRHGRRRCDGPRSPEARQVRPSGSWAPRARSSTPQT